MDENAQTTRVALPPAVSNAIGSQHNSLTTKRRRIASKAAMKMRMDRGELPGFLRKKKAPKHPCVFAREELLECAHCALQRKQI